MIEATCAACGNTEQIAEPADADFAICARCHARIELVGMEDLPTRIARMPIGDDDPADVADLPAPKRPSARRAVVAPEIADLPAPKASRSPPSPGTAAEPISDLPAPKRKSVPSMPAMRPTPAPAPAPPPRNPPAPGSVPGQRNPPAPRGEIEELPPDERKPRKPER